MHQSGSEHACQDGEVGKVWCAVVIEKDTVANRVEVTPPDQSGNPAVRMVVQRMDGTGNVASKSELLTIEPASAPPDQQRPAMPVPDSPDSAERVEPVAKMVVPRPPPRPDAASEAGAGQAQPETEAAATTGEAQLEMDVVPAAEEAQPETEVVASAEVEPPAVEAKPVKKRGNHREEIDGHLHGDRHGRQVDEQGRSPQISLPLPWQHGKSLLIS